MINLQIWRSGDLSGDVVISSFVPFVFLVSFVFALSTATQPGTSGLDALLTGSRCEAAIREQIGQWDGRLGAAITEPALPTGLRSVRMSTGAIGIWLRVVEQGPGELSLERITSTRIERRRFDDGCAVAELAVATPGVPPGSFGDSDLIVRVARSDRGVILLWSPHMPLSVDQHAVLASVAGGLGLAVEALLDPQADVGYAARVARERNLPAAALRRLGGIELALRGMTTHTPSLQVFAGGELVGPVLYGYRNAEALRSALEKTLGK
jgi:hypothetical protein